MLALTLRALLPFQSTEARRDQDQSIAAKPDSHQGLLKNHKQIRNQCRFSCKQVLSNQPNVPMKRLLNKVILRKDDIALLSN